MTEFRFSDEDYKRVKKEAEGIELRQKVEEAKRNKERDESIRTFEGVYRRMQSGQPLFDIPPPSPAPTPATATAPKSKDKDKDRKIQFIQKYSTATMVAESVVVAGIPYFTVARPTDNNGVNITLEDFVPITDEIEYRPFQNEAYLNKPYSFKSREEFDLTIEKAKGERLDSLYKRVKSIWKKYIDADDFHISICAADTIFTYFQDKIGMTHYLFFVGNNNCGEQSPCFKVLGIPKFYIN